MLWESIRSFTRTFSIYFPPQARRNLKIKLQRLWHSSHHITCPGREKKWGGGRKGGHEYLKRPFESCRFKVEYISFSQTQSPWETHWETFYHYLCRHVGGKQSFSLFRVSVIMDINMDEPAQNQKAVRGVSLKEKKALNYSYAELHFGD